jgi:adenosyl cobinamide kinase/adenosyl cobinamide phosphate guanylyltransferase
MPLTFLTGGARSGKSSLAISIAASSGRPVTFIATGTAGDEEMAARIARHRAERPADWTTVEEPVALREAIDAASSGDCVVIDCLTLWVANLMVVGQVSDEAIESLTAESSARAAARTAPTIVVSNEVGSGLHPDNALGRRFRDVLGRVNADFAGASERAALVVAGRLLPLSDARSWLR